MIKFSNHEILIIHFLSNTSLVFLLALIFSFCLLLSELTFLFLFVINQPAKLIIRCYFSV